MKMDLNNYACISTKGRLLKEADDVRGVFERDRDRIIHSMSFRRLQYKTQVFINYEGDHYRTRLTHSLEVAQIARSIARRLKLNEDLAELIALAHDLGHPPFGHAGEDGLREVSASYGNFNHNTQALRVICFLPDKYEKFSGLNLCTESVEGVLKHNGPVDIEEYRAMSNVFDTLIKVKELYNLDFASQASLEAQIAAISDDIAYCNHDIDDGIRAGFLTLNDIAHIPIISDIYKAIEPGTAKKESLFIRNLMTHMILDVVNNTEKLLKKYNIKSYEDVINAPISLVDFSPEMLEMKTELKHILLSKIYKHYKINRINLNCKRVVSKLFDFFKDHPECLPYNWQEKIAKENKYLTILDYIAGMTDRFAIAEYRNIYKLESMPYAY